MKNRNIKFHSAGSIFLGDCVERSTTMPIRSVANNLEKSGKKIVLFTDPQNRLVGICTDGDLRKSILQGANTTSEVSQIVNRNPITTNEVSDYTHVENIMRESQISEIPLLDTNNKFLGLYVDTDDDKPLKLDPVMVIMAGGMGQRLHPHTLDVPKPMLKVASISIIERIIKKASDEGIKKFVISVNYKKDQLIALLGTGDRFSVSIDYVEEPARLGTAGSIALLPKKYLSSTLLVTNGDILHEDSYMKFISHHKAHNAIATMVAKQFTITNPYGVIEVDGLTIKRFMEKPSYSELINAGIYVLDPQCISEIEERYFTMPELFIKLERSFEKRVIIYPMSEVWFDVGTPKDWDAANEFYAKESQVKKNE